MLSVLRYVFPVVPSSPPHRALVAAFLFGLTLSLLSENVSAQLEYNGGLVIQDFDTLPAVGDFTFPDKGPYHFVDSPISASGMEGWSVYQNAGNPLKFSPGDGSVKTASLYSLGAIGDGERAIGHISAGSRKARVALTLQNKTGSTITEFTLAYIGEQWRNGGSGNANQVSFWYRVNATSSNLASTAGKTNLPALNFFSPVSGTAQEPLDGNRPENRAEVGSTVTGISWGADELLTLVWQDEDDPNSQGETDDALAIDDVLFYAPTAATAPTVAATSPVDGAFPVPQNAEITITFDQPVTTSGAWFTLNGSTSGALSGTASGGPMRYTIIPDSPLPVGETIMVTLTGSLITNTGSTPMSGDHLFTFDIVPPSSQITRIHEVQGSGGVSPFHESEVRIEGVVIADYQGDYPALGGFYVQEQDAEVDANPETSEGIFVFDRDLPSPVDVIVGHPVTVVGTVSEYRGWTEIANPTLVSTGGFGPLPTPATVSFPVPDPLFLERYESMRVTIPETLTVTGSELLGYAGELELSSGGALESPTESIDPNDDPASGTTSTGASNAAAVVAAQKANRLRKIILEDGWEGFYPDPTPFLNAQNTRRCGDTLTGLSGILRQVDEDYRIAPEGIPNFTDANPRPAAPEDSPGRLRVASMNVLNYYTSLGEESYHRGAKDVTEFTRQKQKIVAALAALDADVIGLIELENKDMAETEALDDLVTALNTHLGSVVYSAVPDPPAGSGGDDIRNALIYRSARVTPIGDAVLDTDAIWFDHPNYLRPPLAQLFEENGTGERFIVCVNHFKSKSSSGASGDDLDQGDGQASFNDLRRQLATRLDVFLGDVETASSESDILIIGDLNAYGEEDPIDILRAAGWIDQLALSEPGGYSYRRAGERGRLDHALVSPSLAAKTVDATHWAINADEPEFYDYHTEGKSAAQLLINETGPYRSSDHDPVLVDLFYPGYDYWRDNLISWNGADDSPSADPNGNGLTNLEEFIHGTNPLAPGKEPGLITFERTGTDLELNWIQRSGTGTATVTPQWSENLIDWYPMSSPTVESTLDEIREQRKATIPHSDKTELFGRLLIQSP